MNDQLSELLEQANRVSATLANIMRFRREIKKRGGAEPTRGMIACQFCNNNVDWIYRGPRSFSLQCRTINCVKAIG